MYSQVRQIVACQRRQRPPSFAPLVADYPGSHLTFVQLACALARPLDAPSSYTPVILDPIAWRRRDPSVLTASPTCWSNDCLAFCIH